MHCLGGWWDGVENFANWGSEGSIPKINLWQLCPGTDQFVKLQVNTIQQFWCMICWHFFVLQCNKSLRWCPAPECKNAVFAEIVKLDFVRCSCGFRFCFRCGLDEHQPVECDLLKKWLKKCVDDSETTHYLLVNTKVILFIWFLLSDRITDCTQFWFYCRNVPSVVFLLRRMKGATTWHADNATSNSAGFAWATGKITSTTTIHRNDDNFRALAYFFCTRISILLSSWN